jgi:hypothetical protein
MTIQGQCNNILKDNTENGKCIKWPKLFFESFCILFQFDYFAPCKKFLTIQANNKELSTLSIPQHKFTFV